MNTPENINPKYSVIKNLGEGQFGSVYLVFSHEAKAFIALKTVKSEHLANDFVRAWFIKEAESWIRLGGHPNIVRAYAIDQYSGLLFITLEWIIPSIGKEKARTLEDCFSETLSLQQILTLAIQCCHGLEYAYSKGMRCHRDLKPSNIMISRDGIPKITDFGFSGFGELDDLPPKINREKKFVAAKTIAGMQIGTPTHMPPEQFDDSSLCDERSDIYSFGVILFQLTKNGELPFFAESRKKLMRKHKEEDVPNLVSKLSPIIKKCLAKEPTNRFQTFEELRVKLEKLLVRETGKTVEAPEIEEIGPGDASNLSTSYIHLEEYEKALLAAEEALRLNPLQAGSWNNKGICLVNKHRYTEALECFDEALQLNPHEAETWSSKSNCLYEMGLLKEAIGCINEAIKLKKNETLFLNNKATILEKINKLDDALDCYRTSLKIAPNNSVTWFNNANCLIKLREYKSAIASLDRAIEINPLYNKAITNKAGCLLEIGNYSQAINVFNKAIGINKNDYAAWFGKAKAQAALGSRDQAIKSFEIFIKIAEEMIDFPKEFAERIKYAKSQSISLRHE